MLKETFAITVRNARLSQNLTQEELAARCDISDRNLRNIEAAKSNCKMDTVEKICRGLCVSVQLANAQSSTEVLEHV